MKKTFFYSIMAVAACALVLSCEKPSATSEPAPEPVYRTFTCTIAPPPAGDNPTKVAIADNGKTTWEVGDELLIHGEYTKSPYSQIVTLAKENISEDKKTATFTLGEITTYNRSGYKSNLYIAYPASAVLGNDRCYWNTRFSSSNHPLMVGYNNDDTFVLYNICGLITFKVTGDYDTYILEGKHGETVGYSALQTRIRLKDDGTESTDGFPVRTGTQDSYTTVGETSVSAAVTADGSTVNMISIPGGANFTEGFTIKFLKDGSIVKILSTKDKEVNLGYGKILPLGDVTSYLKDYVAPTTHDNEIGVTVASATDLSASASANSYIVSAAGDYKFKAVKGNSSTALSGINKVDILWETVNTTTAPEVNSVIAAADYDLQDGEDAVIVFKTPAALKPGNALIAAKDASGKILWSWHIWIPETVISTNTYGDIMGAVAMDRNLGALVAATAGTSPVDVTSLGLLYQWGRKDPFPGAASLASSPSSAALAGGSITKAAGVITLEESIANPTLMGYTANGDWIDVSDDNLWKNAEKTIYDPCPAGYRVPARDNSKDFWSSDLSAKTGWAEDGTNGWFTLGNPVAVFPFAGYIDDDGLSYKYAGSRAMYWTSHRSGSVTSYGADIRAGSRHQLSSPARSRAGSIRCVAE